MLVYSKSDSFRSAQCCRRVTRRSSHNCSSERHLLLAAATVARVPALFSSVPPFTPPLLACHLFAFSCFPSQKKSCSAVLLFSPSFYSHGFLISPHMLFSFPPINLICFIVLKRIPAFYSISFIGVTFNSLYISNASAKY